MSHTEHIKEKISHLRYGREYSYAHISIDIPEATLRKGISRLIGTSIERSAHGVFYKIAKKPNQSYSIPDTQIYCQFDASKFSHNAFWSSGSRKSTQKVDSIIRNYLSSMDKDDIKYLIKLFGIGRVRKELRSMFQEDYKRGYIDFKGMNIPLTGRWDRNAAFKSISEALV